MQKRIFAVLGVVSLLLLTGFAVKYSSRSALAEDSYEPESTSQRQYVAPFGAFIVDVIVDGESVTQFEANGRRYIEALENAEYEVRIYNPLSVRVAVALSVDGLNTIDGRHTSASDAHKWVIQPHSTITVRGWQMSSENARRFYFTTERDSYGAKIGQTDNLGLISAVFFRERKPIWTTPVTPGRREGRPMKEDGRVRDEKGQTEAPQSAGTGENRDAAKSARAYPQPDDEYAATGIGRSVDNSVSWIKMDLEPTPAGYASIRYEFHSALVRLGVIPRNYPPSRRDVLGRRERAEGFCPQP